MHHCRIAEQWNQCAVATEISDKSLEWGARHFFFIIAFFFHSMIPLLCFVCRWNGLDLLKTDRDRWTNYSVMALIPLLAFQIWGASKRCITERGHTGFTRGRRHALVNRDPDTGHIGKLVYYTKFDQLLIWLVIYALFTTSFMWSRATGRNNYF